jgi:hypothetical protein
LICPEKRLGEESLEPTEHATRLFGMNKYRFELRCLFDDTIFVWPPEEEPPIEAESDDEALRSRAIMCPGDPDNMIPPHVEFSNQMMIEPRDSVEVINTYIESEP